MREFELTLNQELITGLRPDERNVRNNILLTECFNARAHTTGLESFEGISELYSGVDHEWPFPQRIVTKKYEFLIVRIFEVDKFYQIVDGSADLLFEIGKAQYGIGDQYEVADFDEYVLITNGNVQIYRDTVNNIFVLGTSQATVPLCRSYCNFNGQLIGANVQSDWYDCDSRSLIWSAIGDIDCTPDRSNLAGFRTSPFKGDIYRVKKLGEYVIAYGEFGVVAMQPVVDPVPSFAFKTLSVGGLASDFAVGGDEFEHVLIDRSGEIWKIGADLSANKLGYKEYTAELVNEIIITLDTDQRDFYIADGASCFLLSPNGLSQVEEAPTSLFFDAALEGPIFNLSDDEYRVVTDQLDFGYRGRKATQTIEVGCTTSGTTSVAIDYRYTIKEAFERSEWVELNDEGIAKLHVAGVDFRVAVKNTDHDEFDLDYIKLRWKAEDLRAVRGLNTNS